MDAAADAARAQAEDAAELRAALMAPGRALRARIERVPAEGGGEPFRELSLAELARPTAAAGRVSAAAAQSERATLGPSEDKTSHSSTLARGRLQDRDSSAPRVLSQPSRAPGRPPGRGRGCG
jgi:hypothetical protein